MLVLTRKIEFEASHFYCLPEWTDAENRARFGPVSNPHGHNYVLNVSVIGEIDPANGMVVNIKDLDDLLKERIDAQLDHKCLNLDVPAFRDRLPTTENIALFVWRETYAALRESSLAGKCRLTRVRLYESDSLFSEYRGELREGTPMVYLTRAYEFSASHRLHEPSLTDEQNRELFGKCNNPFGHGHNYRAEITLAGEPDVRMGMVADVDALDALVREEILERFDYKHMNTDIPEFRGMNPTSENVVRFLYERLRPHFGETSRLHRVRLYETHKSWFDYGEGET